MLSSTVLPLAITALLSLAASTPTAKLIPRAADRSSWVSVDFQGTTIQYDPTAFVKLDTTVAKRNDGYPTSDNTCGASTFNSGVGPYPVTSDCQALQNWAYSLNAYWSVWTSTPDYHGVAGAGSCEFGAGTHNVYPTWLGSSDMGDLIRDSISKFQYIGLVGARGVMGCDNACSLAGQGSSACSGFSSSFGDGQSSVFWTVYHS